MVISFPALWCILILICLHLGCRRGAGVESLLSGFVTEAIQKKWLAFWYFCAGDDVELKRKSYFSVILVNVEISCSSEMIFIVSAVALSLYIVPSLSDMFARDSWRALHG